MRETYKLEAQYLTKNNIKYLGERIKKEVVIKRIERYFSAFH